MFESPPIARVCAAIGDPVRAAMLVALLDGRALTASELAATGGVSPQTASSHLAKLRDEALVVMEQQGRHRYFRLRDAEVAALLEQLMNVAERSHSKYVRTGPREPALRRARVCYDHLAGELGVALFDGLLARGWLLQQDEALSLSDTGREQLLVLGVDLAVPAKSRRPQCKACLDWSMRRHHLAGALGQQLLEFCFAQKWARREKGTRVLRFSTRGEAAFRRSFISE